MNWGLVAWLKRGSRRKSVLEFINKSNTPVSANDTKKSLHIAVSQASATLKELTEKKLIICLNSHDKIGKLYRISEEGKKIIK
jgi:predicted transcriptional regulator